MPAMQQSGSAKLHDRALLRVEGPDWRSFLQGLITQDVQGVAAGQVRYGALLTPQGRVQADMFIWADERGATLDVDRAGRDAMASRLALYRLRAKVEIGAVDGDVHVLFGPVGTEAVTDDAWRLDPRHPGLGWRAIAGPPSTRALQVDAHAYDAHRLAWGVADVERDQLSTTYAVEANFDLLNGVDFKKGCFVGQEITSRMKRRGPVKSRLLPIVFDGPPPHLGTEVLAGERRAGEVRSGCDGRALALIRLDRLGEGPLTLQGRPAEATPPAWLSEAVAAGAKLGDERNARASDAVQ